jgi:hypothetical protein
MVNRNFVISELSLNYYESLRDMWAVSRKRMDKHVVKERLNAGNQLVRKLGFHR